MQAGLGEPALHGRGHAHSDHAQPRQQIARVTGRVASRAAHLSTAGPLCIPLPSELRRAFEVQLCVRCPTCRFGGRAVKVWRAQARAIVAGIVAWRAPSAISAFLALLSHAGLAIMLLVAWRPLLVHLKHCLSLTGHQTNKPLDSHGATKNTSSAPTHPCHLGPALPNEVHCNPMKCTATP